MLFVFRYRCSKFALKQCVLDSRMQRRSLASSPGPDHAGLGFSQRYGMMNQNLQLSDLFRKRTCNSLHFQVRLHEHYMYMHQNGLELYEFRLESSTSTLKEHSHQLTGNQKHHLCIHRHP